MSILYFTFTFYYYYYFRNLAPILTTHHNVTTHVVCVFSEQDVLVAVSNNISITRFNNNADTANAPRKINLLPTNSIRTTSQLLLNFVENSVLVLHE